MTTATLLNPVDSVLNTTTTNDMGPDGFNYASSTWRIIDNYGHHVTLSENAVGEHYFSFSNDGGLTWADSLIQIALNRGDMAYSTIDDCLYVYWEAADTTDGMIFRRYHFTRDVDNTILSITRENAINTRIDYQGADSADAGANMFYGFPHIIFMADPEFGDHGAVLLHWTARNIEVAHAGTELRSTMLVLANDATDDTRANWQAPLGAPSTSAIGNRPGVDGDLAYNALIAQTSVNVRHTVTTLRPGVGANAKDVYVLYADDAAVGVGRVRLCRMQWASLALDWSNGLTAPATVSAIRRADTDTGYALKTELITKLVCNAAGTYLFAGFPNWKNDTDGDTVSIVRIDVGNNDAVSALTDVYSSGGAHSYAPSCDIYWDATAERLSVSFIKTTTQFAYVRTYMEDLTPDQAELLYFDSGPVDIPLLYPSRVNDKLLSQFRTSATPHVGYQASIEWSVVPDAPPVPPPAPAISAGAFGGVPRMRLGRNRLLFETFLTEEERARLRDVYAIRER